MKNYIYKHRSSPDITGVLKSLSKVSKSMQYIFLRHTIQSEFMTRFVA